jgi:hypothetical protein
MTAPDQMVETMRPRGAGNRGLTGGCLVTDDPQGQCYVPIEVFGHQAELDDQVGRQVFDPERIGLMGDCAGAHLAALVALTPDQFAVEYRGDPNSAVSSNVKAVVGFYGAYDMLAQWQHDQLARPRDQIAEKFIGASPMQNRRVYSTPRR